MGGARRAGGGFDRIKPPEQRVLQRASGPRLDAPEADEEGRAALFTAGPARDRERGRARAQATAEEATEGRAEDRTGALVVHCSRCDATHPLDAQTAVRGALPLFLVNPLRDHPIFAICPSCRHRAWLRVARR